MPRFDELFERQADGAGFKQRDVPHIELEPKAPSFGWHKTTGKLCIATRRNYFDLDFRGELDRGPEGGPYVYGHFWDNGEWVSSAPPLLRPGWGHFTGPRLVCDERGYLSLAPEEVGRSWPNWNRS